MVTSTLTKNQNQNQNQNLKELITPQERIEQVIDNVGINRQ